MPQCEKKIRGHRGAFMLLSSILLALIVVGTMAITSVARHYHERAQRQKSVDEIALMAARDLPNVTLIQPKIHRYLSMLSLHPVSMRQEISPSTVSLTLTFDDEFSAPLGRSQSTRSRFTYSLSARAVANPQRISIFVDTSSYTGPSVVEVNSSHELRFASVPWGTRREGSNAPDAWRSSPLLRDSSEQPAVHYWRYTNTHGRPGMGILPPQSGESIDAIYPRLLTQQCFNPTLQSMKEAAIRLYDSHAVARSTSIAITTGPVLARSSDGSFSSEIVSIRNLIPSGLDFQSHRGAFIYSASPLSSNSLCLALAEESLRTGELRFAVPPRSESLPRLNFSASPHGGLTTQVAYTIDGKAYWGTSVPPSSAAQISVREALWALSTTRAYDSSLVPSSVRIDVSAVLESVRLHLLSSLPAHTESGTSFSPSYAAYLLMGDVPWENGNRLLRHAKSSSSCNGSAPWHCWKNHIDGAADYALEQGLTDLDALAEQVGIPHAIIYYVYAKHPGNYWEKVGSKGFGRETPGSPVLFPFDSAADRAYLCPDEGAEGSVSDCEQFVRESEYFANRVQSINSKLKRIEMVVVRVADTQRLPNSFSAFAPLQGRSVVLAQ